MKVLKIALLGLGVSSSAFGANNLEYPLLMVCTDTHQEIVVAVGERGFPAFVILDDPKRVQEGTYEGVVVRRVDSGIQLRWNMPLEGQPYYVTHYQLTINREALGGTQMNLATYEPNMGGPDASAAPAPIRMYCSNF